MFKKIRFWLTANRLGPDMPLTHILLHSKRLGTKLCQRKFAHFGKGSAVRPGSYVICTDMISIGDSVVIRPATMLFASPHGNGTANITIEDLVSIGSGVHIYTANHEYRDTSRPIFEQGHREVQPVVVKKGAWIGANAIILPGVTVGENSVVGAGSVVTKDVAAFTVVAGQPAKTIKQLKT